MPTRLPPLIAAPEILVSIASACTLASSAERSSAFLASSEACTAFFVESLLPRRSASPSSRCATRMCADSACTFSLASISSRSILIRSMPFRFDSTSDCARVSAPASERIVSALATFIWAASSAALLAFLSAALAPCNRAVLVVKTPWALRSSDVRSAFSCVPATVFFTAMSARVTRSWASCTCCARDATSAAPDLIVSAVCAAAAVDVLRLFLADAMSVPSVAALACASMYFSLASSSNLTIFWAYSCIFRSTLLMGSSLTVASSISARPFLFCADAFAFSRRMSPSAAAACSSSTSACARAAMTRAGSARRPSRLTRPALVVAPSRTSFTSASGRVECGGISCTTPGAGVSYLNVTLPPVLEPSPANHVCPAVLDADTVTRPPAGWHGTDGSVFSLGRHRACGTGAVQLR